MLTPQKIKTRLAAYFNINENDFFYKKLLGKEDLVFRRAVFAYCLWRFTELNLKQISIEIYRERSAVLPLIRIIRKSYFVESERKKIIEIESLFE